MSNSMPPPHNIPQQMSSQATTLAQQHQLRQLAQQNQQRFVQQQQQQQLRIQQQQQIQHLQLQQQQQQQLQQRTPAQPQQQAPGLNPYMNQSFLSPMTQSTRASVVSILAQTTNNVLKDLGHTSTADAPTRIRILENEKAALYQDNTTLHQSYRDAVEDAAHAMRLLDMERAKAAAATPKDYLDKLKRLQDTVAKLTTERNQLHRALEELKRASSTTDAFLKLYDQYREAVKSQRALWAHCQGCPGYMKQMPSIVANNGIPPEQSVPGMSPFLIPPANSTTSTSWPNMQAGPSQTTGPSTVHASQSRLSMPANGHSEQYRQPGQRPHSSTTVPTPAMVLQGHNNSMPPPSSTPLVAGQQRVAQSPSQLNMNGVNSPSPMLQAQTQGSHSRSSSLGQQSNQQQQPRPATTPISLQPINPHIDLTLTDVPTQIFSNAYMNVDQNKRQAHSRAASVTSVSSTSRPNSAASITRHPASSSANRQQLELPRHSLTPLTMQQAQQQQQQQQQLLLLRHQQQQHQQRQQQLAQSRSLPTTPHIPAISTANFTSQPSPIAPADFTPASIIRAAQTASPQVGVAANFNPQEIATPPPPSGSTDGSNIFLRQGLKQEPPADIMDTSMEGVDSTPHLATKRSSRVFDNPSLTPDDSNKRMRMSADADIGQPSGSSISLGTGVAVPAPSGPMPSAIVNGGTPVPSTPVAPSTLTTSHSPCAPPQVPDAAAEDDDDDDEEEVTVGPDGLRVTSECLAQLFEGSGSERVCKLCKARHEKGVVTEAPVPFVDATDELLVQHCIMEHEAAWTEIREDV